MSTRSTVYVIISKNVQRENFLEKMAKQKKNSPRKIIQWRKRPNPKITTEKRVH